MHAAGLIYELGDGAPADKAAAERWYAKARLAAAKQPEDPDSIFTMGLLEFWGRAGPRNQKKAAELWTRATKMGHVDAPGNLAHAYLTGRGVEKDERGARRLYELASERGSSAAQAWLGGQLAVEKDLRAARRWFSKAAAQGNPEAIRELGLQRHEGFGVKRDYREALRLLQDAAERGEPRAQIAVGTCLRDGHGTEVDPLGALRWWTRAADQGDAEGMQLVASSFEIGWGVSKDEKAARDWYRRAAERGHTRAMTQLAWMHLQGRGGPYDAKEGARWARRAKDAGSLDGQDLLAHLHTLGHGVPHDLKKALELWRDAADKGHGHSAARLGFAYANGPAYGVATDPAQARRWDERGAELGDAMAQHNLAYGLYREGGQEKVERARALWKKAAEHGHIESMRKLATAALAVDSGRRGKREAVRWLRKAAASGDAASQAALANALWEGGNGRGDFAEAAQAARRSAEANYAHGQFLFGAMTMHGHGVPADHTTAIGLWRKAAAQMHPDALYVLGKVYETGTMGEVTDLPLAFGLYHLGAEAGSAQAKERMLALAAGYSESQREFGIRRASDQLFPRPK